MAATILYLNTMPGDRTHEMTLAGIRRYAAARGWNAEAVPKRGLGPKRLAALLVARRPVAGCIVECPDDSMRFPPRLFGAVPVVYLHPPSALRNGRAAYVAADNVSVARVAFRELSAGRPAAFAVVGNAWKVDWSDVRSRTFQSLAAGAGMPCHVFPAQKEGNARRAKRLSDWVGALPRNCAIFAVNDDVAAEIVAAARHAARAIPRELTLLGVDNLVAVCEASRPSITSIQLDHERAGFLAARLLAARIKGLAGHEMKGRAGHEMKGRAEHEMKGAAYAANEITSSFAPTAHPSFGANVATLNSRSARPSFHQWAEGSDNASVGPLMAVRRESTRGHGRRDPAILAAVEDIRRKACDGLTVAALADRFPGSRRLFDMRFREAMGHSALDEILQVRMEQVMGLLSRPDFPIDAIADFCGFGCRYELRKLFHARYGVSMSQWRHDNCQ